MMDTHERDTHDATTGTGKRFSAYAALNQQDWVPANYDDKIYNPAGYDAWEWELYQPYLVRIVERLARGHDRFKYLDFACGTGRIIAVLEPLATESMGMDISAPMVGYARRKVRQSTILCADLLEEPGVVGTDFDLITAFRFFLNTETDLRSLVMSALAGKLAGSESRLIFNIHMNGWSVDGLKSIYRRLRWGGWLRMMSYPEVRRLVREAGLEIEEWAGFGLWPYRLYTGRLGPVCRWIDCWAARVRPLRWISHDMLFVCRLRPDTRQ